MAFLSRRATVLVASLLVLMLVVNPRVDARGERESGRGADRGGVRGAEERGATRGARVSREELARKARGDPSSNRDRMTDKELIQERIDAAVMKKVREEGYSEEEAREHIHRMITREL